jgi:3-oxoadipate enol-lactonase
MPDAQVNGFRMYYEVHGEGLPVLYIHGGMGGVRSVVRYPWEASDRAVPGLRFVFYDRRGFARSQAPDRGYDLPTFAADARGLLDHLGIDRCIVIGTSAGGPIALQFAIEDPERVLALALANTSVTLWVDDDTSAFVRELVGVLETEGPEAAFERRPDYVRHSLEPLWRWPDAGAHGWLDQSVDEENELARLAAALPQDEQMRRHAAELRTCRAYMALDLVPRLPEIKCPVLLVHGETDTVVPPSGSEALARSIPHAELVTIPDAGHMILDHPEAQNALRGFLWRIAEECAAGHGALRHD